MASRRFYQAGRHTAKKPPSVQSPFAQLRCYLHWGDVSAISSEGVTPPSSLLRAHVPLPLGSLLLRHLASLEESWQVVRSPCCPRELPDVISESLSLDAGSHTPAVHRVLSPVSSAMSSAFPKQRWVGFSRMSHELRLLVRASLEVADIPLCSGLQVCSPPRSFLPLRILPQGSRGFYIRAYRALLPPHAPDMLTVRTQVIDGTGTFTLSDFQPCRLLTPFLALSFASVTLSRPCHVSSPLHVARSMRISRTARPHLLNATAYGTYPAGATFGPLRRTR